MRKPTAMIVVILSLLISSKSIAPATIDPLDLWYQGYNVKFFNSELPQRVIIDHGLHDDRYMGLTDYDWQQKLFIIRMNEKYGPSPKQERETLLHEMCHVRQIVEGDEQLDQHGPHWQSCMHDLANKGAFDDLW